MEPWGPFAPEALSELWQSVQYIIVATVIGDFRLGTFWFTPGATTGWNEKADVSNSNRVFVWVIFLVIVD